MERKNAWKCPEGCPDSKRQLKANKPKSPKQIVSKVLELPESIVSPVISAAKVPKPSAPSTEKRVDTTYHVEPCTNENGGGFLSEERFRQILKNELLCLKTQNTSVSLHLKSIDDKFNCFQENISFINTQVEEMKVKLMEKKSAVDELEKKNAALETTVPDLATRLSLAEQHMRESNVEINGLPEKACVKVDISDDHA
ncbi:Chromosome segregation ATPase [Operophtera brumata]|uniref:Chromosome segregation ATPase n=1 Tax=Operophtera brumata TaxID=104452 RepID=A0A0L7L691_OPEBR|nr:Chromosome segregation ATPase [Operophtera brumata]